VDAVAFPPDARLLAETPSVEDRGEFVVFASVMTGPDVVVLGFVVVCVVVVFLDGAFVVDDGGDLVAVVDCALVFDVAKFVESGFVVVCVVVGEVVVVVVVVVDGGDIVVVVLDGASDVDDGCDLFVVVGELVFAVA